MAAVIEIQNARFEYTGYEEDDVTVAVHDASLDIQEGEMIALIGHNGSGKSTLAKLMNALILPTSGRVLVRGMDTADEKNLWNIRRTAGMVFQNPDNQIVATIVQEDVAFGLENLGVPPPEIRARVQSALETVNMAAYADSAPHLLSGGQKQRVAIAGLIAMRPDVLIFDEATAMLDPSGRREVLDTVRRLNRESHMTVVWITHFMEETVDCDRVAVVDNGRILRIDRPRDLFQHVAELKSIGLDTPQMTELALALRQNGLDLSPDILRVEEMVEALCRLKSAR